MCLGPGWASASNAPFRRHKIWVHEGGIATPLVVHWPKGISAREDHDAWELFDLSTDRCEQVNLAAQHPDLMRKMEAKWTEMKKEYRRSAEGSSL